MLGFAPVSVLPVSALPEVTANNYSISALNGTYALTGQTAILAYTPSAGYAITALNGNYVVTGQSAAIVWAGGGPVTGPQQYFIEIRSFTERRSFC